MHPAMSCLVISLRAGTQSHLSLHQDLPDARPVICLISGPVLRNGVDLDVALFW